jgi:hypothetical protein
MATLVICFVIGAPLASATTRGGFSRGFAIGALAALLRRQR